MKHYGHFDPYGLDSAKNPLTDLQWGGYYCRHVGALTTENLHSKAEIAAELGWRDLQIDTLKAELAGAKRQSVRMYNSGYRAGHHDTVEGQYTDILPCDMNTYHADIVAALAAEGDGK